MIIYKITNMLNGKIYIGQTTTSLRRRWTLHCAKSSSCLALKAAISLYGRDNFTIEQIDQAGDLEELNKKEVSWIAYFNSVSPIGYNLTSGGLNCLRTEEFRQNKAKFRHTEECKKRMSEIAKGKKHSEESKMKMSKTRKGRVLTADHIEKVRTNSTTKKAIIRSDGVVFSSIGEAARAIDGTTCGISRVLSGSRKKHRGYNFQYVKGSKYE